jgi:hypothetical protein
MRVMHSTSQDGPTVDHSHYSSLYYKDSSALLVEIKHLYKLYISGDSATLSCYKHLFSNEADPSEPPASAEEVDPAAENVLSATVEVSPPTGEVPLPAEQSTTSADGESTQTSPAPKVLPFIHFQQALIREKVKTMSAEEEAAVERYINEQRAAALKVWEWLWLTAPRTSKLPEELTTLIEPGISEEDLEMEYYQK